MEVKHVAQRPSLMCAPTAASCLPTPPVKPQQEPIHQRTENPKTHKSPTNIRGVIVALF
jgi:hypothetical protein